MNDLRLNLTSDINRACEQANDKADEAISFAKLAGALLLEAKASLPHGEWEPWLLANVWVSPRQCRRYMQIAQGKPLPIRAPAPQKLPAPKTDTSMTVLKVDAPRNFPGLPDEPQFVPDAGKCFATVRQDGAVYLVEPSSRHPGFFFVTRMNTDDESYDCTQRPIAAAFVEISLQYYGLNEPAAAEWRVEQSAGVLTAMETFDGVAA